jgi:hypothetical protein
MRDVSEDILKCHAAGEGIAALAGAHNRSPRAVALRLRRLGMTPRQE